MRLRLLWLMSLCWLALPARAELWAFVDGTGVATFADHPVDSRFTPVFLSGAKGGGSVRVPGKTMSPSGILTWLEFAPEVKAVQPMLREAAAVTGVDAELLTAIIAVESGFKSDSVSPRGAVGLMQITPATAERYLSRQELGKLPVELQLRDSRLNVLVGARMLADLWQRLGGIDVALAAWNAGEGRVRQAGGRVPAIDETRSHVHMVLELYWALLQQRQLGRARDMRLAEPHSKR